MTAHRPSTASIDYRQQERLARIEQYRRDAAAGRDLGSGTIGVKR